MDNQLDECEAGQCNHYDCALWRLNRENFGGIKASPQDREIVEPVLEQMSKIAEKNEELKKLINE